MITKLTVVFLSVFAGTMIGLFLSRRLTRRRKYFEDLISLINGLESDLRFKQNGICEILALHTAPMTSKVKDNAGEYIAFVEGGELNFTKHDLTPRELTPVREFFSSIGTLDLSTQLFVFDSYRTKFKEFYAECDRQEKAYGKMYIKLGFLFGLALGIIVL